MMDMAKKTWFSPFGTIVLFTGLTFYILILVFGVDFLNLIELYKEEAPWSNKKPIEHKHCYLLSKDTILFNAIGIYEK